MKKILSIFLVACMILSMSILAFAEDDGTNAELEAQGYKGITTEEELKSQTGKFYLKNDIEITSGKGGNKTDTYIDGNGHTVTLAGGLTMVNWGKNVEMRNITIDGEVILNDGDTTEAVFNDKPTGGSNDSSHYGPFSIHGIDEKLYVENCHSKVNITINVSDLPGSIGGFLGKSHGSNATWKNVSYTGTLNIGSGAMTNGDAQMRTIGGIAGMSGSNLIAENVKVDATINCNATNVSGLGGLFGITRAGNNSFKNCYFNGALNFGGTCEAQYGIGGIAGWVMGTPFIAEGLTNNGTVTATNTENEGPVGGIFGSVDAKGSNMEFDKVSNTGNITGTKTAGGVVGEFVGGAELTATDEKHGFKLSAVRNTGNVSAPMAAGGLVGKINQLPAYVDGTSADYFVVEFSNVVNSGNISATAEGAEGAGAAVGVMPAAPEEGIYSFTVKTIFHTGEVTGENSTPLLKVNTDWLLGETENNYYCQAAVGSHFGEKVDKDLIEEFISEIDFIQLDTYMLSSSVSKLDGKLESDYTPETWKPAADAVAAGKALLEAEKTTQDAVDEARKAIDDAVAALVFKQVDKAALDEIIAAAGKLEKDLYRGDTWRKLDRALEDAKVEFVKQSDVDAAVAKIQEAIDGLALKDTEPAETDPVETDPPAGGNNDATQKPTDAAKPTDGKTDEKGGCGSAIAATAVVLTAVLALGTGVALKKKED